MSAINSVVAMLVLIQVAAADLSHCETVSMLQTGFTVEEDQRRSDASESFDAEVASLSQDMVELKESFESMENDTARYHEAMRGLSTVTLQGTTASRLLEELSTLARSSSGSFDSWCLAHSDLVLGVLSFSITSVLIALCIPCGLAPVQVIAWFLSQDKPPAPNVVKEHG
eukprot:symbB.v1.2.005321.t1/scaffold278.1/size243006/2